MVKHWFIEKIEDHDFDSEENMFLADFWSITDGLTTYIFPVSEYPTKDDAWKAWESKF